MGDDSFLEDLELVPTDVKNVSPYAMDRHVTSRSATSTPLQHLLPHKGENFHHKTEQSALTEKQSGTKELNVGDLKKLSEQDAKKQHIRIKVSERREMRSENKLKPIENKVKTDDKELAVSDNIKAKIRETRVKISESKIVAKDRTNRSGSCKENNQSSNVSVKENNRPPNCSKESASQVEICKDKGKSNSCAKKLDSKETDAVALLNAIKDIVSLYTKQESSNILRVMQELHFNSQANFIKQILDQTDELVNEMHPSKDSNRVRCLVEQNERLKEENIILQKRNEDLHKRLEEFEFLKQENVSLKLKCKELSKQ
ncbi:uncharacterized protein LOC143147577 isoform X1 [Ptiloglossa arizonensis]|uniref:uncharacterized protein LOC143147577 isoform X1 n=1 Tax=Ptiloglossa arizonensis TaxID=3350558 RepID=UPI003F9F2DDE